MINQYLIDYEKFSKELYPLTTLDFSKDFTKDTIRTLFKSTEIISTYVNSITSIDSWITLKLNEIKNQLLISLYYLPHYTDYIFNTFKRSVSELILRVILYSASSEAKIVGYQETVNNMQFRFLKIKLKELPLYVGPDKNLIDVFFSFYGESSNNIHMKEAASIIEYIESYKVITQNQIKNFKNFVIKLEEFLLTTFPKIYSINDLSLSLSAKMQLKEILSVTKYLKHFGV